MSVLLGPQWTPVVDLVRLIALAFLAGFSQFLANAVLIAAGHVRDTMLIALWVLPIIALVFVAAALQGLLTAAASLIAICFLRALVSNAFVCRRLAIDWSEITRPLLRSLAVSEMAMGGPLAIVALGGFDFHVGPAAAVVIGAAALPGWFLGLRVTNHAVGAEISRVVQRLSRTWP